MDNDAQTTITYRKFTVRLSREVHKYIRKYRRYLEYRDGKRITFPVAMEEFIRHYGKEFENEIHENEE